MVMRWLQGGSKKLFWLGGGGAALTVIMLSCSTTTRTILAPPSIPGATYVGSNECATCHEEITRGFATASHARLKAPGENAKDVGCESCHGPGSLHVAAGGGAGSIVNPRESPTACFQCHLEVRAAFELPHRHPVLEGKIGCADCHNPHEGSAMKGGQTSGIQAVKGGGTALLSEDGTCIQCHTAQRGPFVFEHEALREGCVSCHAPHGSVNQRLLAVRNAALCLKCHFQQQTAPGVIVIGERDHSSFLQQGTCWSAGCHEAVHGSQVNSHLRY
jgi:predicted CXXCH cytochrome family protein